MKTETKVKDFVKRHAGTIAISGAFLAVGCLLGYNAGHSKGFRTGRNDAFNDIVGASSHDGLCMKSSLGKYVFKAVEVIDEK